MGSLWLPRVKAPRIVGLRDSVSQQRRKANPVTHKVVRSGSFFLHAQRCAKSPQFPSSIARRVAQPPPVPSSFAHRSTRRALGFLLQPCTEPHDLLRFLLSTRAETYEDTIDPASFVARKFAQRAARSSLTSTAGKAACESFFGRNLLHFSGNRVLKIYLSRGNFSPS